MHVHLFVFYIIFSNEKCVWNLYYKNMSSHLQVIFHILCRFQFLFFSNRRMKGFKTNINRHICFITGVIAVEIRKRNFHETFQHIRIGIRKRTAWAYFCTISSHCEVLQVRLWRIIGWGFQCLFLFRTTNHIVSGVKYYYWH